MFPVCDEVPFAGVQPAPMDFGMKSNLLLACVACVAFAAPAAAGETVDPDGQVSAPIVIRNSGAAPILCQAELAHWFATDLARVTPGQNASLDLRFQPRDGSWAAINARGEALPVERAWCGLEGSAYATRWNLSLGRDDPRAQKLDCRAQGDALRCD